MYRTLPICFALALALSACDSGGGNESAPGTTDIADNGTAAQSLAVDSANEATDASTTEFAQETTGNTSPAGEDGVDGDAGPIGPAGPAGLIWRGEWAADTNFVARDAVSFEGSSWVAIASSVSVEPDSDEMAWSLLARKGDEGEQGPAGRAGAQGRPGNATVGATGAVGATGPAGPQGIAGAPGVQGDVGPAGARGAQGPAGDAGADGEAGMTWIGAFQSGATYTEDDVVEYNGSSYIALVDTDGSQAPTDTAHWALVAERGADGAVGPAGATGPAGLPGAEGAQGPQGLQGPEGLQGAVGPIGNTGATGPEGPTGPQGIAGANGVDGEDGVDGAKGMSWQGPYTPGTLYVADDVVEFNGASYIALQDNEGEYEPTAATHWELVADRGLDGAVGATGATGPAGITGVDGAQGPQGIQGPVGPIGNTGATGPTGPQGLAGANGLDGEDGADGATGMNWQGSYTPGTLYVADDVVEFNGASYIALQDNEGDYEPTAATHWELVADRGADGAMGAIGATGSAGAPGVDGAQGPQGLQGPVGPIGNTGAVGPAGPTGPQGLAGANGLDGEDGADGAKGMNWQGSYQPGTLYVADDVVEFNGASYIALQDNEGDYEPTAATHWELVADRGLAGAVGAKGMNWQGQYFPGAGYVADDVVEFNGSSYIALRDTEGEFDPTATTHWELLAERGLDGAVGAAGSPGADGAQGAQGIAGATGAQGPTGPMGLQGNTGAAGQQGATGPQGVPGTDGTDGQPGARGLSWQGSWVPGVGYAEDDAVAYQNGSYVAIADTSGEESPDNSLFWQALVKGPTAETSYEFVGFSVATKTGNDGYFGMNEACQLTFGDESRLANTSDVFYSTKTSEFTGTAWIDTTKDKNRFVSDAVFGQLIGFNPNGHETVLENCRGWGTTSFHGLLIDGPTYRFVTGDCVDAHPVACSLPSVEAHPDYRFAGLSSADVAGNGGLRDIKLACQADYGPEARVATTEDVSKGYPDASSPPGLSGWVLPIVGNGKPDIYTSTTGAGSCSGFSSGGGLHVDGNTGNFSAHSCSDATPVACAVPDQ